MDRADLWQGIGHADALNGAANRLGQDVRDGRAKAARHPLFLCGDRAQKVWGAVSRFWTVRKFRACAVVQ